MSTSMFSLTGSHYIVTGSSGLLGQQHCLSIAEAGGTPIMIDLDIEQSSTLAKSIHNEFNLTPLVFKADISREDELQVLLSSIIDLNVAGLINNASRNPTVSSSGVLFSNRIEDFSIDEWNRDLSVGLTGSFLCTKTFSPLIYNSSKSGSIVNISSDLGLIAPNQSLYSDIPPTRPDSTVKPVTYSVIKSALIGLTRYTATYYAHVGLRCNCLCPGGVQHQQSSDFLNRINNLIPMARMASVDEYRGAIIFLLSSASSYMTGSVLSIDGGRTCW